MNLFDSAKRSLVRYKAYRLWTPEAAGTSLKLQVVEKDARGEHLSGITIGPYYRGLDN